MNKTINYRLAKPGNHTIKEDSDQCLRQQTRLKKTVRGDMGNSQFVFLNPEILGMENGPGIAILDSQQG